MRKRKSTSWLRGQGEEAGVVLSIAVAFLLGISVSPSLHAQTLSRSGEDLSAYRIGVEWGGMLPMADLAIPERYRGEFSSTKFGEALGVGALLERRLSDRWGVELHVLNAFNTDLTITTVNGVEVSVERDVLAAGLSGLYYLWPQGPLDSFISAGAGVKSTDPSAIFDFSRPPLDPSLNLGGGISANVTDYFSVRFTARDVISWYNEIPQYETSIQHDLWLTAGGYIHF